MIRRVKRGKITRIRRIKVFFFRIGAIRSNSHVFGLAQENRIQSINFLYINRKMYKRKYQFLWLLRIHARAQFINKQYSYFIYNIRQHKCILNRKILAQLVLFNSITLYYFINIKLISHIQNYTLGNRIF